MRKKKKSVIRTISKKYQITIPKRFGEDLGIGPESHVTVTEDAQGKRIIIQAFALTSQEKAAKKTAFIEACKKLGAKWAKLGVTEKDVEEAIRESRRLAS